MKVTSAPARFVLPASWEPHARCWLAWPTPRRWRLRYEAACCDLERIAEAISGFEPVTLLADPEHAAAVEAMCGSFVERVVPLPLDDLWLRDTGPAFLTHPYKPSVGLTWRFNAWGRKHDTYDRDAVPGAALLQQLDLDAIASPLVCEGGAICSDGEGTLLTTESVLLNPNRNPGLSRQQVEWSPPPELRRPQGRPSSAECPRFSISRPPHLSYRHRRRRSRRRWAALPHPLPA